MIDFNLIECLKVELILLLKLILLEVKICIFKFLQLILTLNLLFNLLLHECIQLTNENQINNKKGNVN